jgi:hypothetical protein
MGGEQPGRMERKVRPMPSARWLKVGCPAAAGILLLLAFEFQRECNNFYAGGAATGAKEPEGHQGERLGCTKPGPAVHSCVGVRMQGVGLVL